jgi:hypothetical protein
VEREASSVKSQWSDPEWAGVGCDVPRNSADPQGVDGTLRALGVSCAVGGGVSALAAVVSLFLESETLLKSALLALLVFVLIPYLAMRLHLAATHTLTERQKGVGTM